MKRFLFNVSLIVILVSCSSRTNFIESINFASVVEVQPPDVDSLVIGQDYEFIVTYNLETTCDNFEEFLIEEDERDLFIGTVVKTVAESGCEIINTQVTSDEVFLFTAEDNGFDRYEFFFLQNPQAEGESAYIKFEFPLVSE